MFKKKNENFIDYDEKVSYSYAISEMVEYVDKTFIYNDGTLLRCRVYSLFPQVNIDNTPILNTFGQKIYNDLTLSKKERRKQNELFSSLR